MLNHVLLITLSNSTLSATNTHNVNMLLMNTKNLFISNRNNNKDVN